MSNPDQERKKTRAELALEEAVRLHPDILELEIGPSGWVIGAQSKINGNSLDYSSGATRKWAVYYLAAMNASLVGTHSKKETKHGNLINFWG